MKAQRFKKNSKVPARLPVEVQEEDHIGTYLEEISAHDLLDAKDQKDLARKLEFTETKTWALIFHRPDTVRTVVERLENRLGRLLNLSKLLRSATLFAKPGGKGVNARRMRALEIVAASVAPGIRTLDLDREHVSAIIAELARMPNANLNHLADVQAAYREASTLRERFIKANLRLVVTMARRYDHGAMPLADLIQEGNLGLMHSIPRFDHRRNLRFSTYAVWWIRHAIGRALADKARAVRIPVHTLEAHQSAEKVRTALTAKFGHAPTNAEIAKACRVKLSKLDLMDQCLMRQGVSLDRPVHVEDFYSAGEMLIDPKTEEITPDDELDTQARFDKLNELLQTSGGKLQGDLTALEVDILTRRFGLGGAETATLQEIAEAHGLTRDRVRVLQAEALRKLKEALLDD